MLPLGVSLYCDYFAADIPGLIGGAVPFAVGCGVVQGASGFVLCAEASLRDPRGSVSLRAPGFCLGPGLVSFSRGAKEVFPGTPLGFLRPG